MKMETEFNVPSFEDKEKEAELNRMVSGFAEVLRFAKKLPPSQIKVFNDQHAKTFELIKKISNLLEV